MAEVHRENRPSPQPAAPRRRHEMPAVGEHVYYRLTSNMELVPAEVIDRIPGNGPPPNDTALLNPPDPDTVHLKISLDPRRHHSSGPVGYRTNVPEQDPDADRTGNTFVREQPDGEERWFAERQTRLGMEQDIRRRIMREGTLG